MKQCPACGNQVDEQSNACGFCGHDFTGRLASGLSVGESPYVQQARARSRWGPLLVVLIVLVVGATAVGGVFFVGKEVTDAFTDTGVDVTTGGGGVEPQQIDTSAEGTFKGIKPLVAELKANGVKCKRTNVIVSNGTLESGSCFMGTDSLTILVYFNQLAFDASVSSMESTQGKSLAFGKNWLVLAPTSPEIAKAAAKALGGKVGRP